MSGAVRRVLVVDDMKSMRVLVRATLEQDPNIEVVGEASNALEARELLISLKPDVMTLDVEMPKMRGDVFLKQVMTLRPLPVIMLSQLTKPNSPLAIAALADGAVECLGKPTRAEDIIDGPFAQKLCGAVCAASLPLPLAPVAKTAVPKGAVNWNGRYLMIGASTGGVVALQSILSQFPEDCPPTIVAQHMPENFIRSMVGWMNDRIAPSVALATHGQALTRGQVLFSAGGQENAVVVPGKVPHIGSIAHRSQDRFCPSIDVLFHSAAKLGDRAVGVILTGMGRDGAQGLRCIHDAGGTTLVQDQASSVVYGMPKAAKALGGAQIECRLDDIGARLLQICGADELN